MTTSKSLASSPLQMPAWLSTSGRQPSDYLSDDYVVVDFEVETNHGDHGNPVFADNRLLLACYKRHGLPTESYWGTELEQRGLLESLGSSALFMVAHNAKYECGWLRRAGVDLRRVAVFDTQIAAYLERKNRGASLSLETCARSRGLPGKDPVVDRMIKSGINPKHIPRRWLEQRCRYDVEVTEQIFLLQREEFRRADRLPLLFTRCNLTPVLADIEAEGFCLDAAAVDGECKAARRRLQELDKAFAELSGGINPRSRPQLAELIYGKLSFAELRDRSGKPKRTPKGGRLTDQKSLAKLKARTDEQKAFVALQKERGQVDALLSKNLNCFEYVCENQNGILYGQFNQTVTATGRLSATGLDTGGGSVQFQNLPRRLKPVFKARRPGWLVGEIDGSQLEFRVAAYLGNDRQAIEDIRDPSWDAHITSAAAMAGVGYDELYKQYAAGDKRAAKLRQEAKTETFKPLYGGQKGTEQQERWYRYFRERYSGLAKTQQGWVNEVLSAKHLRTDWGQIFHWPEATIDNRGFINVATQVSNYPVQAFATAEIVPIAVCSFWQRVAAEGLERAIRCVNTVHDSVVCELDPAARADFIRLGKLAFTTDVYGYLEHIYGIRWIDDLPLGIGVKIGERWGTGEELKWDIYKSGREVLRS